MPTAIITGCSRPTGFGQLTAKTFARAGFDVFATMRRASERRADLDAWALEEDVIDLSNLSIDGRTLDQVCQETKNDGLVILHKGKLVYETYDHGMDAHTPHILMSVSKSVLGLLGGVLVGKGVLQPDVLLTDYIPELENTAWKGATVRESPEVVAGRW